MNVIYTTDDSYHRTAFTNEADLESAVVKLQKELFGNNRIYFNIKKKIGKAGKVQNIPDGYLLDLTGSKPRLFVVEVELDKHDTFHHIAKQILQFCYTTRPTSQGGKDEQYNLARYENGQYINVLENYDEDTDEVSHSTLLEAQKLCVFMK